MPPASIGGPGLAGLYATAQTLRRGAAEASGPWCSEQKTRRAPARLRLGEAATCCRRRSAPDPMKLTNRLIASLPDAERRRLLADCEAVDLVFGQVLCEPGEPYRHAWFPLKGFISTVAIVGDHQPLE